MTKPTIQTTTMTLTNEQLKQIYPYSTETNRRKYLPYINKFAELFGVIYPEELSAFLAQTGHESGQLRYTEEIASGKAYEGRKDLGNVFRGDGVRYKGRGLIQITGRANYTKISEDTGIDFITYPQWLCEPEYTVMSAFWFWSKNNLNKYATGKETDFKTLTRRINGGLNGYADRLNLWNRAKKVLNNL